MRLPLSGFASPLIRTPTAPLAQSERPARLRGYVALIGLALAWAVLCCCGLRAQQGAEPAAATSAQARGERTRQFLLQRQSANTAAQSSPAAARLRAYGGFAQASEGGHPLAGSLTAPWQPLGPVAVASASYGNVSGRVTAVAVDPNDTTGNTVYVGTTGGGVWKSTNAAGALGSVGFTPLTDVLPVFTTNAGGSTIPSLSVGAVAVQPLANPVVLAGTGDPNDATDSYYGEGILRSADGGLTWTLAAGSNDGANGHHSFVGLSVAGLAWSTATPSLVVAALSGSAEGVLVDATNSISIAGLYVSSDAGVTWRMATIYDGASVVQAPQPTGVGAASNPTTAVVWDALRQKFYAAVRLHGFYESADGLTWQRLANQPGTGLTTVACPASTSSGCPLFRGALAVQAATGDLYALSVDGSLRDNGLWQDLCAATGSACANAAPTFAHRIDAGALETGNGSTAIAQGDYNLTLAAASASSTSTVLLAGTVDVYRCVLAAGSSACALRNTTNALNGCAAPAGVAPAQHALALFAAAGGPLVFIGNDGGLWRSPDGIAETGSACAGTDAAHFNNLNGALGSLAEITGFAEHPTDPDTLLAGLAENGSAATSTASAALAGRTPWTQLSAGEGGYPLLDPNTPADWIAAIGAGVNFRQCMLGPGCTAAGSFSGTASVGLTQVAGDAAALDAPALLDPALTTNLLTGTCRVWRGPANGAGWSAANALSKPFGGGTTPCSATSALVRSVGAGGPAAASAMSGNAGSTVLYAGMAGTLDGGGSSVGGHVFVTTAGATATGTTAWTDAALGKVTNDTANAGVFNPNGFDISSVTPDPHDATGATVYATIMGFGSATAAAPHVYRSIDFGAHWLNLTANLPDAPANALLVDPNDANTVYVALDTGVYATSAVSTCTTQNCWSLLGTGLPNAPVTALAAAPNLLTGDGRRGLLRAGTYGRGLWSTPLLTAQNLLQPAITVSPGSLTFGAQAVATQSAAQAFTITSNGNSPVTFTTLSLTGDFTEQDTCAGKTLAVGAACAVQVTFAPTATGTRTGLLTVYENVAGGQATATLTGSATAAAALVLTPVALSFAATVVNATTASQIVTIANTGGTSSALAAPVVRGDFSLTANTCGSTLAPQTACSVAVAFTPTASGARNGTLVFTDDAGTQTATLTGNGEAPATDTLSAAALTFATTQIGSASGTQQVTLTNAGDVALLLVNATVAAGPFTAANTCSASLAAHASCAVTVAFVPVATGTATGLLTVADQFRTQTVALSGFAVAPPGVSLTPVGGLAFTATGVGLTTPAQSLTLTNNGGVPLVVASTVVGGDFHLATTTCPVTLQPAAACTLAIVFAPTAAGARAGALTLTDNAPGGTQTVVLSGTGVDFALVPSGATTATVTSGTSATYPLLLSSAASLGGTVALTCTGAPAHSTCLASPANAALGTTVSIVVTVQTGLATASAQPPSVFEDRLGNRAATIFLACLLPAGLFFARRRRGPGRLLPLLLAVAVTATQGCGSGREIPAAGTGVTATPTPSGTYNLTVTAVSTGVTHTVGLTLIVQ